MSDEHDFAALARAAADRHGFSGAARIMPFVVTENPTFRADEDGREPRILRVYRPGNRREPEIRSELAWMRAIGEDGVVGVAPVLPATDGSEVIEVGRPGAPIHVVGFGVAPGRALDDDDLPAMMFRLGALMAGLHRQARGWTPPPWFDRMRWDVATTLGDTPHWGPWHASVFDLEERRQLQVLADVVRARLEAFGTGPEHFGLCHADLRMANILHDEETDAITLIDFDDAGLSWFLYDLGPTFTLCEERATPDLLADWVEGYRSVAPLSEEDARELPTFLMLRRLLVSAFAGHRSDIDLAAEMHASGYATQSCVLAETYLSEFG